MEIISINYEGKKTVVNTNKKNQKKSKWHKVGETVAAITGSAVIFLTFFVIMPCL